MNGYIAERYVSDGFDINGKEMLRKAFPEEASTMLALKREDGTIVDVIEYVS